MRPNSDCDVFRLGPYPRERVRTRSVGRSSDVESAGVSGWKLICSWMFGPRAGAVCCPIAGEEIKNEKQLLFVLCI